MSKTVQNNLTEEGKTTLNRHMTHMTLSHHTIRQYLVIAGTEELVPTEGSHCTKAQTNALPLLSLFGRSVMCENLSPKPLNPTLNRDPYLLCCFYAFSAIAGPTHGLRCG